MNGACTRGAFAEIADLAPRALAKVGALWVARVDEIERLDPIAAAELRAAMANHLSRHKGPLVP